MIQRQSEKIESLKTRIEELEIACKEKDDELKSIDSLRVELTNYVNDIRKYKDEYKTLVEDLRKMKDTINETVYKNRWSLCKINYIFFINLIKVSKSLFLTLPIAAMRVLNCVQS